MPFLTISTLFLLAGVFTGGCVLSWFLCERRNERERSRLEESMTRALEQRYQVYEDLEESFHRIFSRMDEIRERWQEQMASVQESVAGNLGQTTFVRQGVEELVERVDAMGAELQAQMANALKAARPASAGLGERIEAEPSHALMRVENPELWDLEREFERRNAEQLTEISAKSQRVTELMKKIEALEPLALQLAERDREFVALEAEREQLVKTNNALEDTRRARAAELSQRIEELELVEVEAGELRKQVQTARSELVEKSGLSKSQVVELECKVAEVSLELAAVREQHETAVEVAADERVRFEEERERFDREQAEREQAMQELHGKIEQLEQRAESLVSDVNTRDEILVDREARLNELQAQLVTLQGELEQRATELDERERKFEQLQGAWKMATGQVESQRSKLAAHMGHFHAAQEMLAQLKPMLAELETRLTTDDDDGPAVVVSDVMSEGATLVDDGTLDELPADAEEVIEAVSVDEFPAPLPASDLVEEADEEADTFDLSYTERDERDRA